MAKPGRSAHVTLRRCVALALLLLATTGCPPRPSPPSSPGEISFRGDWERGITGPGNWTTAQLVEPDRLQRVTSPVRQGQYAARVEVRPGDRWRTTSGERAEVANMSREDGSLSPENAASGTQFYGFSVRLEPNWQTPRGAGDPGGPATCPGRSRAWGIILQLHGPDQLPGGPAGTFSTSPAFAFNVTDPRAPDAFSVSTNAGELDPNDPFKNQTTYPLSESQLNRDQWVDFILEIHWAADTSGRINVWRRDEGDANFAQVLSVNNIATLQYVGSVEDHYWKHGFYRTECNITNILWLDGMTRGATFDAVRNAAFGT